MLNLFNFKNGVVLSCKIVNKEEYKKALKDPRWLTKRKRIKKRDKYKCVKCNCKDNLHVHHTYYLPNKMPWAVPDDCLITLCKTCHEKEHEGRDIKSFIKAKPPKHKNKSTPLKHSPMSEADRDLQGKLPEATYKPLENPPRNFPKKRKKKPKRK